MERNACHITPSYCHLPESSGNLIDGCGSFGSCKPQIEFIYSFNFNVKLDSVCNFCANAESRQLSELVDRDLWLRVAALIRSGN